MKSERGFTLLELTIVVAVIAIVGIMVGPAVSDYVTSLTGTTTEKNDSNNLAIKDALTANARSTALGKLPQPYTGGGLYSAVYNPADSSPAGVVLANNLQKQVPTAQINSDGTAGGSVRVYQLVSGIPFPMPLYAQSGPQVTLTFQQGAIYMTSCLQSDTSCNPSPSGIPGSSAVMTMANYNGWAVSGSDQDAVIVSSLPVQMDMLSSTTITLDKVRDALKSFFVTAQVTAAAGDATNFYPTDTVTALGGQNPGTNQGCRDGWYSLATTNILPQIGLSAANESTTAWGGLIEYCRDYDPLGSKTANASPHYAAIRIRSSVSLGLAPDPGVAGSNIFLTF